eukprot:UN2140
MPICCLQHTGLRVQGSYHQIFLLLSVVIYCLSVRTISSHDHRQALRIGNRGLAYERFPSVSLAFCY